MEIFRDSWQIFCCERNMAHEAGFLTQEFLKFHQKNMSVAQHEVGDYGWWTVTGSKVKYAYKVC